MHATLGSDLPDCRPAGSSYAPQIARTRARSTRIRRWSFRKAIPALALATVATAFGSTQAQRSAPPATAAVGADASPFISASPASAPLCTPSGLCWENPYPSASSVGYDGMASMAAGTVAVGSGGNVLRIRGGVLDLLEPTGRDVEVAVAIDDARAFLAGDLGYLAELDVRDGSRSAKARAFPDTSTSPIFSIAALGRERVFVTSLHGAIAEWTPRGYVDRSIRSGFAGTDLAQNGSTIVVTHGYSISSFEGAPAPWTQSFAEPLTRAVVVDDTHMFALGLHGTLSERDATGWATVLDWPHTLSDASSFLDVAVVRRANRPPLILTAMGLGGVFAREGFREHGGAFAEETVPWAADRGAHIRRFAVLEDGTVLGVGSVLAARSPDGTWRGARPRQYASYYAVVRSGRDEAWAAGSSGDLAHYAGGRWVTYGRTLLTGDVLVLVASPTVPGEILGLTSYGEWFARGVDGTLRVERLPSSDLWKALVALPDGRFVAGGRGRLLFRNGTENRVEEFPDAPMAVLATFRGKLLFAKEGTVFEVTPAGDVPLVELPLAPHLDEPIEISALFAPSGANGDELFIGTTSLGIYRFANGRLTVEKPVETEGPRNDRRAVADQIESFSNGPSGFYVATGGGVVLRRTAERRFTVVPKEPWSNGDEISSLYDANGTLYALGRVVWRLTDGRLSVVHTGATGLRTAIALPSGDTLIGGVQGTLIRIPGSARPAPRRD